MQVWQSFFKDPADVQRGFEWATLRRAWTYARHDAGRIAVYVVLLVGSAVLSIVPPLLFRQIIDVALPRRDLGLLLALSGIAVGLSLAGAALLLLSRWLGLVIGNGVIVELRRSLYNHILRMPLAFFVRAQTGKLQSRVTQDVNQASSLFTDTISSFAIDVITLAAAIATMFVLSWPVAAASVLVVPLFVVPAGRVGRWTRPIYWALLKQYGVISARMAERFNVSGALVAKVFGDSGTEDRGFTEQARLLQRHQVKVGLMVSSFIAVLTLVGTLSVVIVYAVGGREVILGTLSLGTLVALASLVQRLYQPLVDLASARVNLVSGLVSFQRVFEVLDLQPQITDDPAARPLERSLGRVEFDQVWFRYAAPADISLESLEDEKNLPLPTEPSDWVLRGVSFEARPGELVALIGPSGAGKTTLCSLLPRLYDATSGAVRIDGQDIRSVTLDSLAAQIGIVPQDPFLFHESVLDNLRYARPEATREQVEAACRAACIHEVIATLPDGYDTIVGERGFRFSGGEKQRLAIARVLLKDPAILILDEATSHLDSETEALVQAALAAAMAGRTSFVIAHRLSTIAAAHQVLVLQAGEVVERGRPQELLAQGGLYAALYSRQSGGWAEEAAGA